MSQVQSREPLTCAQRTQRSSMVTSHRTVLSDASKHLLITLEGDGGGDVDTHTLARCRPRRRASNLPKNVRLTPIYLSDMRRREGDHVYKGTILNLTLIDDPIIGQCSANFIAEDDNKDVLRLSLACAQVPIVSKLVFGTKIGILNPWFRMATDGMPLVRVDNLENIFILGKKIAMCRYCGAEFATWACVNCDKRYCTRACQVADWRYMNHRLVCTGEINILRVGMCLIIFGMYLFYSYFYY